MGEFLWTELHILLFENTTRNQIPTHVCACIINLICRLLEKSQSS